MLYTLEKENVKIEDEISDADLELIKSHTVEQNIDKNDLFVFRVRLCDTNIDRVFDKMTPHFIEQVANRASGMPCLFDHVWEADGIEARVYKAESVKEGNECYVKLYCYCLSSQKDTIDRIRYGLLREVSIGFESIHDKCSICGCETTKGKNGETLCPNGHTMGKEYDGKLCYNIIDELSDLLEFSFVSVPAQRQASIIKNFTGGILMRRSELMLRRFKASHKGLSEEDIEILDKISDEKSEEASSEDIEAIIAENERLKAENADMAEKLKAYEDAEKAENAKACVKGLLAKSFTMHPKIEEAILDKVDLDSFDPSNEEAAQTFVDSIAKEWEGLIQPIIEDGEVDVQDVSMGTAKTKGMTQVKTNAQPVSNGTFTFI